MNKLVIFFSALMLISACREEPQNLDSLECVLIDGIMVCPGVETEDHASLKYCRYELVSATGQNCKEPRYLCMPCMEVCEPELKETINNCEYTMKLLETECTECFDIANTAE